jgi:hypothetical protein
MLVFAIYRIRRLSEAAVGTCNGAPPPPRPRGQRNQGPRWRLPAWLVLLGLLHGASVRAQYRVDSWTTENGLPQNSVYAILQTRDGYLWFTTLDGLVRYNGAQFVVFVQHQHQRACQPTLQLPARRRRRQLMDRQR